MEGATGGEPMTVEQAEANVQHWQGQYERLKQELSRLTSKGPNLTSSDHTVIRVLEVDFGAALRYLEKANEALQIAKLSSARTKVVRISDDNLSTTSRQSTAIKRLEIAKKKKIVQLRREHDQKSAELHQQIEAIKKSNSDEEKSQAEIQVLESQQQKLDILYGKKMFAVEEDFQLDKEEIEVLEEEKAEQYLDKDEENIVKKWNSNHHSSAGNEAIAKPSVENHGSSAFISSQPIDYMGDPRQQGYMQSFVPNKAANQQGRSAQHYPSGSTFQNPARSYSPTQQHQPMYSNSQLPPRNYGNFTTQQQPSGVNKDDLMLTLMSSQLQLLQRQKERRLPEFDGNPTSWSSFANTFIKTKSVDVGEDMRRLQGALKGQARQAVEHLFANDANVPYIMEILERRFGRPELILNHLIQQVRESKSPDPQKPATLVTFGTLVESIVCNIDSYGRQDYMYNPVLVDELVNKLPIRLREDWYMKVLDGCPSSMLEFSSWLKRHVNVATLSMTTKDILHEGEEKNKTEKKTRCSIQVAVDGDKKKKGCYFCDSSDHIAYKCDTFKKLSIEERWDMVKEKKLCFICFSPHHRTGECERKPCPVDDCGKAHNSLLHSNEKAKGKSFSKKSKKTHKSTSSSAGNRSESEAEEKSDNEKEVEALTKRLQQLEARSPKKKDEPEKKDSFVGVVVSSSSLPILPIKVYGPQGTITVKALLDCGATCTMIEEDVVKQIGLDGEKSPFHFSVFGKSNQVERNSKLVKMKIAGDFRGAAKHELEGVRTVKTLGIPGHSIDVGQLKAKHSHLHQLKMKSLDGERPQMVIGVNQFSLFRPRRALEAKRNEPSAYKGLLGWYVIQSQQQKESCQLIMESIDDAMHKDMKDFFSTESFGVKPFISSTRSKEDEKAQSLFDMNTKKVSGKWETCLLWKDEEAILPESRTMALKRLHTMEKKMDRDPAFAKLCMEKFIDYIGKQYLKKCEKSSNDSKRRYYLPWFFAYHPSKKPRLVFDAAAESHGRSLNSFLMKGPDMIQPLTAVLTRFRLHQVALCADIREMFHQVRLVDKDKPAQTILFRGMNRRDPPKEYEMTVLFFGSASSPSSAIYTKNLNAEKFSSQYPKAVESTIYETYVDDVLTGEETVEDAIELYKKILYIHDDGGFPLLKWNSSNPVVMEAIPAELRAHGEVTFDNKGDIASEKTLGLLWNPATDEFAFKLSLTKVPQDVIEGKSFPTKRQMCSIVMSLFDPLGLVAPLKVKGMIILQNIWRNQTGWDDEVTSEVNDQWLAWFQELKTVTRVRVPRKLSPFKIAVAEREMKDYLQKWKTEDIANVMLRRGIDWHFIGPASPHMGGSWESPIRNVKRVLYKIFNEQYPKEGDLITFLTEVEFILNSRPLTRASPDPEDMTCLTPNHFLNLPCVIGPSIPEAANGKDLRRSWRLVQKLSRDFWKRWSVEYLPWLAKRQKWTKEAKPLAVRDVVVVLDDNAKRNDWKMGIITQVFPGKDGQVRTVEVKVAYRDPDNPSKETKISYFRRPAVKICPLNLNADEITSQFGRENGIE